MAKYVFDSNIFINLQRRQPIDIFPSLWNRIGELKKDGTIISSQEVYDEIMIGGKMGKSPQRILFAIQRTSATGSSRNPFFTPWVSRRWK